MPRLSRSFHITPGTWRAVAACVTLAAAIAIVATYRVFSQTHDEPAHIAAGLEWLTTGHYTFEAQHPPLARVAAAIGPYLAGERTIGDSMWGEGARILGTGDHYVRILALARLGQLPFFLLLCGVTWAWGRRLAGEAGGGLAVLFVATNPNILAHAGLATTDIAPAALVPAVLLAFERWLASPTLRRSLIFGVCVALAFVSKFSTVVFLAPSLAIGYGLSARMRGTWRLTPSPHGPTARSALAAAVGTMMLVIWAVYRFEVGPMSDLNVVLPAPAFFQGLLDFGMHGALGHTSFLLGRVSHQGWWYYFPVVLLVKTPLPLLLFGTLGTVHAARCARDHGWWVPALLLVGMAAALAVAIAGHVDIGVRHILPVYSLLAVLAAYGARLAWRVFAERESPVARVWRPAVVAAVAVSLVIPIGAHPDHLAYFSITAGSHPERVLSDSNIDWGQDLYRLADEVRRRGIDTLRLAYFGTGDPAAAGVRNVQPLPRNEHVTGWIAVSETYLAGVWTDTAYVWLQKYEPVTRVGRSIRLYWLKPGAGGGPSAISMTPRRPALD